VIQAVRKVEGLSMIGPLVLPSPAVQCSSLLLLDVEQENKHWEAAFQVYERGTALFKYPHVADIWAAYLKSFVARCGSVCCD
jgi:hypothetical protein